MERWTDLLLDNQSVAGRLVTSLVILLGAWILGWLASRMLTRHIDEQYARYHLRKAVNYAFVVFALVALAILWKPFAGRITVVFGLFAAGLAFAMQEVVGAIAGWFNILTGRIFRVGDRIEMGGVRGDVIDITPLRTKILEMGSATDETTWVGGRQHTGRIVAISNKTTFTAPVYNYSSMFEFIWEELRLPIPHHADWQTAETILLEEVRSTSASQGATAALEEMSRRYPIPRAELEPRVFIRGTDNWMELAARFVVPVRSARIEKDDLTRRVHARLKDQGIEIASETLDVHVRDDRSSD